MLQRTTMEIETLSKHDTGSQSRNPPQDNFYTPSNREFYKANLYSDLDASKQEIRLLQLLPVKESDPLAVRLETSSLRSPTTPPPKYNAISYFAGSHEETELIYVDGVCFNAFATLARALRSAALGRENSKLQDCPQLFWADQICINQSNPTERSHQVGFMRSIYEQADTVLGYLGEDPSNGHWVEAATYLSLRYLSSNIRMESEILYMGDHDVGDFRSENFQKIWSSVGDILKSPWWRRGWIYQEAIVARRLFVLFGEGIIDWEILSPAIKVIQETGAIFLRQLQRRQVESTWGGTKPFLPLNMDADHACATIESRKDWQHKHEKNIIEILSHGLDCGVTDPRDRVFAFVGLADPGYGIQPDYNSNVSAVLKHACKRIILYEESLDILTCAPDTSSGQPRIGDLPSWTPDWSRSEYHAFDFIYDAVHDFPSFRASSDYPAAAAFHPHKSCSDGVLKVQCLFIDYLGTQPETNPLPRQAREVWESMAGLQNDGNDRLYEFDLSMSIKTAFWEVILRGKSSLFEDNDDKVDQLAQIVHETEEFGRFFRSPKGYLGMTKDVVNLRDTDQICVLLGANVPFILRRLDNFFVVISDAYVEGLMYGEAIQAMRSGDSHVESIEIH